MNPSTRSLGPENTRLAAAVLMVIALLAMAADIYAQVG